VFVDRQMADGRWQICLGCVCTVKIVEEAVQVDNWGRRGEKEAQKSKDICTLAEEDGQQRRGEKEGGRRVGGLKRAATGRVIMYYGRAVSRMVVSVGKIDMSRAA